MMPRAIKSFVLRNGRVSQRQLQAFEKLLSIYELPKQLWNYQEIFKRDAPTVIEIGFGMGDSLLEMATERPDLNFIGIEVHVPGVGSLLAKIHERNLTNIRIANFDAVEVFKEYILDNTVETIQIFFPDPWPKKRHHKRRLIQSEFVKIIVEKLKPGGILHCATDWQDYAEHMKSILSQEPLLENTQSDNGFSARPEWRPLTKFEQRGQRLGHNIWDLLYRKT